jgi:hypothetical protein
MSTINLKKIWRVPKYLPYVQPTLTDEIIDQAEKQIGYRLPSKYLELLKIQNGGYIRYTIKDTCHAEIYGIGPYYPSLTDYTYLSEYDDLSFQLEGLIPFDGDGHWFLCFDYRENKTEPQITYIDTECDTQEVIANSFKEYLYLLYMDVEDEYRIETFSPIKEILAEISVIINVTFNEPDCDSYGYPVYSAQLDDSWIWISPNKAPNGFIREEDERYDELKDQMQGTSIRYPEIGENDLLISVSNEEVQQKLFDLLKINGINLTPLKEYV